MDAAAARIQPYVHRTPVMTSRALNALAGSELYFKCENLQKVGAFKARGAVNAVLQSDAQVFATHSSGNHGAALSFAAAQTQRQAHVVMPENATAVKRQAVLRYGGQVITSGPTLAEREGKLAELLASENAEVVPPYDDVRVIAGQGTAALELVEEVPGLRELWVPVGGGGLAAGCVAALGDSAVAVCAAEPELAADAHESMRLGARQPPMSPVTVAEGLRTSLGVLNFEMLNSYGLRVTLVSEEEILTSQREMMSCLKVLVEPSSAVVFAAIKKVRPAGRVGIIVTGGNVEL